MSTLSTSSIVAVIIAAVTAVSTMTGAAHTASVKLLTMIHRGRCNKPIGLDGAQDPPMLWLLAIIPGLAAVVVGLDMLDALDGLPSRGP